jgi:quinol monooxygenase YgiN
MPFLLQVDFEMDGPYGEAMVQAFEGLAHSINQEPGMLWKIWTEDPDHKQAGGVYLFDTHAHAQQYLQMHTARLTQAGVRNLRAKIFAVNEALSAINHGPVTVG